MENALRLAAGLAAALLAMNAAAQTSAQGRRAFVKQKCLQCHYFEARSIAPSVKVMKGGFKGMPSKVAEQITGNAAHAAEVKGVPAESVRAMAVWIAEASFEDEAAAQAAPKPGSPEAKRLAAQKAREEREAKAKAAAEAKAQAQRAAAEAKANAKREAEEKARAAAEAKSRAKAEALAKAKADADAKAQAKKDTADKARQDADAKAQAQRDAAAQAKAQREKEELAKREADAKARKDATALEAIRKENEERAKREAELAAQQKREAEAKAKQEAEAKAKREADLAAQQKRDADAKAKQEAEAKAKRDADLAAQQKREAEAKAKQEADAKAQAAAKKPEPAAEAPAAAPATKTAKKKRGYSDGSNLPPCPKPTGAPMPPLDENAAKTIIERVGCAQCHAYVQKKTGPPMKRIYEKYKGDWECVVSRLTHNDTHKEEGVTDDLKGNEPKTVGAYIATRDK